MSRHQGSDLNEQPSSSPPKKRSKKFIWGLLGLSSIFLIAIALIFSPKIIQYFVFREIQKLELKLHRSIQVKDLQVHSPKAFTLSKLSVSSKRGEAFFQASDLFVQFSKIPGLNDDAKVSSLKILKPTVILQKHSDGSSNFQDIQEYLEKLLKASSPKKKSTSNNWKKFFKPLPDIVISQGEVVFKDLSEPKAQNFFFQKLSRIELHLQLPPGETHGLQFKGHWILYAKFNDHQKWRAFPMEVSGTFIDWNQADLTLSFLKDIALPLDDSQRYTGVHWRKIEVVLTALDNNPQKVSLKRSLVYVHYAIGPLAWVEVYSLADLSWIERDIHGFQIQQERSWAVQNDEQEGFRPWTDGDDDLFDEKDLRPMMSSGEGYSEYYDLVCNTPEMRLKARFQIANIGFGDYKAWVKGYLKLKKDGIEVKRYGFNKKYDRSSWSMPDQGFELNLNHWILKGKPGDLILQGIGSKDGEEVQYQFHFKGLSWRPGTGVVFFDDQGSQYMKYAILMGPGHCEGSFTINDQKTKTQGEAYGKHFASNISPQEVIKHSIHFEDQQKDLFVEWRHTETGPSLDNRALDSFLISYQAQPVFESTSIEYKGSNFWTDGDHYGYVIPRDLEVTAKDDRGHTVHLVIHTQHIDPKDLLKRLPPLERSVAQQFAKPIEYHNKITWTLEFSEVLNPEIPLKVQGSTSYNFTILNP